MLGVGKVIRIEGTVAQLSQHQLMRDGAYYEFVTVDADDGQSYKIKRLIAGADINQDLQIGNHLVLHILPFRNLFTALIKRNVILATETERGVSVGLRSLKRGDTLVVWRLDRLGRSIRHLIDVIGRLQARGVEFRSITENIDTSSAGGRMIFHVIAAMAEFERSLISERTIAGMAAARQRGQSLGRRRSLTAVQCTEARQALNQNGENLADVARRYDVHPRTLKRLIAGTETAGVDVS